MSLLQLKGLGPIKKKNLEKLSIFTIQDLLGYFPKTYEDRTKLIHLCEARDNIFGLFRVILTSHPKTYRFKYKQSVTSFRATDGSSFCKISIFHYSFGKIDYQIGEEIYFYGKAKFENHRLIFQNPIIEKGLYGELGRIYPIYGLTEGISNKDIQQWIKEILVHYGNQIRENLPVKMLQELNLIDRKTALNNIHFPLNIEMAEKAKKRLSLEELFYFQLGIEQTIKDHMLFGDGISFLNQGDKNEFIKNIPYALTNAQKKVLDEIWEDMESSKRMNRLIQGDVGSGKTILAFAAAWKAIQNGYQATIMAPTEILAKQHFETAREIFKDTIQLQLLIGSQNEKEKNLTYKNLQNGDIKLLIATHTAIQEKIEFAKLGLIVIDEQHRFGVKQRKALFQKGVVPDMIIMSATPIPRTLGMILYSDMDISVIDEMPPGRQVVNTYVVGIAMEERVANFACKEIDKGGQVYVICPLIEESEKLNLNAAQEVFHRLSTGYFKKYISALVHGKMKADEKERIMESFFKGEIDILISTTVIEVGVNVPNANLMIVYNAERFGLAQLHQLRGRVGRSSNKANCILFHMNPSEKSVERMRIIKSTNDGFLIAKKDMELRGIGDFFGTRQSGLPELKFTDVLLDEEQLNRIRCYVKNLLEKDPNLLENDIIKENLHYFLSKNTGMTM